MYYLSSMGTAQKMTCNHSFIATAITLGLENSQWHGHDITCMYHCRHYSLEFHHRQETEVVVDSNLKQWKWKSHTHTKNECILGNCTRKNVQIRSTTNIQSLLPWPLPKENDIWDSCQSSCYCFRILKKESRRDKSNFHYFNSFMQWNLIMWQPESYSSNNDII